MPTTSEDPKKREETRMIKIARSTAAELKLSKKYRLETYDEIIQRLLRFYNMNITEARKRGSSE